MDKAKVVEYLEEIFKTDDLASAKCFAKLALEEVTGSHSKTPYLIRRTHSEAKYLYRSVQQLRAATKWDIQRCKEVINSGFGTAWYFNTPEECRLFWYKLNPELRPLFEIVYI